MFVTRLQPGAANSDQLLNRLFDGTRDPERTRAAVVMREDAIDLPVERESRDAWRYVAVPSSSLDLRDAVVGWAVNSDDGWRFEPGLLTRSGPNVYPVDFRKSTAMTPSTSTHLLRLAPNARGYVLDGEPHRGFADRPDLPLDERARLARWAARYTPDDVSETQRPLLALSPSVLSNTDRALLEAVLVDAEADNARAVRLGFHDLLDDDELRRIRAARYPLGVNGLAELTGASAKQIRDWSNGGLLPHHRVGSQRRFFSAAAIHAAALRRLDPYQVAVLGLLLRGGDSLSAFLPLLGGTMESLASRLDGAASSELAEAGRAIARHSHEIAASDRSAA